MEIFYTSYTRLIQNETYYFVKRYQRFPEYKNVTDVLEGYGMHKEFEKACRIAGIQDPEIIKRLLEEIDSAAPQAKVIDLNPGNNMSKTNNL